MNSEEKANFKKTILGLIPEKWEIQDFSRILNDASLRNGLTKPTEIRGKGVKMVNMGELFSHDRIMNVEMERVPLSESERKTYLLQKGDLLFARQSILLSGVGKCSIFLNDVEDVTFEGHIIRARIDPKKANPFFLYYFFQSRMGRKIIEGYAEQVAAAGIRGSDLKRIPIVLPNLPEQSAIANFLFNLDCKIENNLEMNKTLEQISKAVFKRWFVDFEFPNKEGKPYKSSGGEMVYNEELTQEIPKNWTVTALNTVAEFGRGFSYNGKEKSKLDGEFAFVTLNSIYEGGGFKREFSYLTSNRLKERHLVKEGDIVIANTEQTRTGTLLGFPALVEFPNNYNKDVGCFSHHITKVSPFSEELKYYLYHYLYFNQLNAVKYQTGSVIWALDVKSFTENEKIIVPDKKVLGVFSQLINAIFQRKLLNNKQSTSLGAIRDILLPKLISGKIRVPIKKCGDRNV